MIRASSQDFAPTTIYYRMGLSRNFCNMKSRQFLFIALFLLLYIASYSQSKIVVSGKVTDARTGESLAGTTVYFPDLKTGAATNAGGDYSISNIPTGRYLVEISHLGYASVAEVVELTGDSKKDFKLDPSVVENEGVTVTGVSAATSTRRTPIPVNIIRRDDLLRGVSTNLIDNIARTAGVSQVSTGPAISKPFIRGLGYNRVLVVNDGVRQEGQQWGDEHGIEIDEQNVNKVEVLKGPASLMYGSDALAGVINVISILPPPEGSIKGNVSAGYFSNNRQRNLHADIGGNSNGFIWGLNGSYKAAADYRNKYDGYVFNSKFNERALGAYLGLNKNWGYTHLYFTRFDQKVGLVEGERDDATGKFLKLVNVGGMEEETIATNDDFKSTNPFVPRQHIRHSKIAADNSFRMGRGRLTFVLGYQKNERMEFGNVVDPDEKELFFDLRTVNYNLQYHFPERKNWKTTIGVNGMGQSNQNKGAEQLIPEYDLFDIGGFIYSQKRFSQLSLSGGLRFDNRSLNSKLLMDGPDEKFPAFKKNFSNLSGSLGFSYEASKMVTLKLNLARGFRAPSIPELASNGAHEGTNRYEYGEQDLSSETSLQADAGVEISSEHLSFSLSAFYNNLRNFIYYRKLVSTSGGDSIILDGSEEFFAFRFTQDNATLAGLEFNLDIHPHPLDWLHIENTFSWVRGRLNEVQDGSRNLPFIPAARLINELKMDIWKNGKRIRNVFFSAELDNTFKQNRPFTGYNTETETPGYSLLHLAAGGDVRCRNKTIFRVFAGVNNVTDKAFQNHLSRLKYAPENAVTGRMGVYNMGRNFSVKLVVPFEFN
jgi:iron complex outermembrane recepter protein